MIRYKLIGAVILALFAAAFPRVGNAQSVLPKAGQSFSFGIIEGPYSFADSESYWDGTSVILTVVSAYSGCGIITSPTGYSQDFNFAPGAPTILNLPLGLMHRDDLGKTQKGLLVQTTEPVNLVMHDYVRYGGDATQILPDGALDTSYITCGWGIWDEPGENNLNEFLITAVSDSTLVTITPSVNTLLGQPNNVPFLVMLNRGECYIVKADTSDRPSDPSLSGSIVHATKLVSVISGLTCGYVDRDGTCNELMDELIGRKWWGTHFFMQPLDVNDSGGQLVLTSSTDFNANINGSTYSSSNSRIAMQFTGTLEIHTLDSNGNPFPVEAHQLTRDASYCGSSTGDPSLVTILDTSYYADTALWNTPSFDFSHCVSIICPTADLGRATLDGTPFDLLGATLTVINGSGYSAIIPQVQAGLHEIVSPDPIFAISAGFFFTDAYTFIAGTAGTQVPHSIQHAVALQADSAMTCTGFTDTVTASLATPILSTEEVNSLTLTMTYDPSTLELIGFVPLGLLNNATFTIDTSVPGTLTITVIGKPLITGSQLFRLIFRGLKTTNATNLGIQGVATTICGDFETLSGAPFSLVVPSGNPFHPLISTQIQTAVTKSGYETLVAFDIDSTFKQYPIYSFEALIHANFPLKNVTIQPSPGWVLDTSSIDSESLTLNYARDTNSTDTNGQVVLTFSYSDSVSNNIQFSITPILLNGQTITPCISANSYTFTPSCADQILRMALNGPILFSIKSISPNPAMDEVTVLVAAVGEHAVSYQVMDVLGAVRAEGEVSSDELTLDVHSLANGLYYLRVRDEAIGTTASGKFVVER